MNPDLRYAANYLLFHHPCYLKRSLLAYQASGAHPSPLQRSYQAKGSRLAFVLNALGPDAEAPPTGLPGALPSDLSF
jgi:hypothetical protein